VVSTAEKAHMMRQVRAGKANASEPLLKCRKRVDGIGTGAGILPRDESGGCLRSWPGGVRHEGGASPVQAPVRNAGTLAAMLPAGVLRPAGVREVSRQRKLQGAEYRCAAGGRTAS
jgi:hypothetical protein